MWLARQSCVAQWHDSFKAIQAHRDAWNNYLVNGLVDEARGFGLACPMVNQGVQGVLPTCFLVMRRNSRGGEYGYYSK
jgi:hypothetical protein